MMSTLANIFNTVIDRAVCLVGYGKSIVDAINGISNNILHKVTYRKVEEAADAGSANDDVKNSLPVHVFEEGEGRISPANNCCLILEKYHSITVSRRRKRTKKKEETLKICIFM